MTRKKKKKKKTAMQFSEYLWKKQQQKFIVSNTKHIEKKNRIRL